MLIEELVRLHRTAKADLISLGSPGYVLPDIVSGLIR
jgi:hypothetical protein